MAKKRRVVDDEELEQDAQPQMSCTTIDHVYPPDSVPDTKCFCGKRTWKPFIKLDDYLHEGDLIRTTPGGPICRVEMVNQSRARCRAISIDEALQRARKVYNEDPDDESSGKVFNISPRSACERVTEDQLVQETQPQKVRADMAKAVGTIPVAGRSVKDREADRRAKLAAKPKGEARPLTGAAAKAKANARPKVAKTVRKCGCGCGEETMSYFVPGHDARYKGWLKKLADGRLDQAGLRKLMGQKTFDKYTFKKVGAGFAPKETYQEAAGN